MANKTIIESTRSIIFAHIKRGCMEMIDLYNETGELVGQTATRDEVHSEGMWHRTVHVWVRNASGQILLQQRSALKDTNPSLWDVSAAGHISAGQTSPEAALRELEEELGLVIIEDELKFLFTVSHTYKSDDGTILDCEHQDVYLVDKEVKLTELLCDPAEVQAVAWIAPTDLRKHVEAKDPGLVEHDQEYAQLWAHLGLQ